MARESTEGQAIELAWIRGNRWDLRDADYIRMVHKKTGWYTFLAPASIGSLAADAGRATSLALRKYAALLGIAFQIQDDVLNLVGEGDRYGKEVAGDLWEGKHTLILLHAMRSASAHDRERAQAVLAKERPHPPATNGNGACAGGDGLAAILDRFVRSGEVSETARAAILAAGRAANGASGAGVKTPADVQLLIELIERAGSIPYARDVARDYATRALRALREAAELEPSVHRDFLTELAHFVVSRDH
jgi:geranylgeranyl diphosphate synthase type II